MNNLLLKIDQLRTAVLANEFTDIEIERASDVLTYLIEHKEYDIDDDLKRQLVLGWYVDTCYKNSLDDKEMP